MAERAGDMHLDPVATNLDLTAHLSHQLILAAHQPGIGHGAVVGHEPASGTADRGHQGITTDDHARAFNHAVVDCLLEVHAQVKNRVRVKKPGQP